MEILNSVEVIDADKNKGAFLSPTVIAERKSFCNQKTVHTIEAFGPVSTLMPYNTNDEAIELAKWAKVHWYVLSLQLVSTIAKEFVFGAATHHGRILVLNNECAKESTGHGSPLTITGAWRPGQGRWW